MAETGAAWLHGSAGGLLVLGVVVGLGAGVGAVVFRALITGATRVFTGASDYGLAGRVENPHVPGLGVWFLVLAPVVGGLIYGPLISRFASEAQGHGVPEVMLAVAENGGRIRPRVAVVKSLASALCIGSGGSVGREGPIVQIGSALGSTLGQRLRIPESRLRLLVACGAAGGISATFNAPIAGVFFALELILRDFEVESFGVVVFGAVVAHVIGRAAFGAQPFLHLPPFQQRSLWEYGLYVGLGLVAALVGTAFVRVLYGMEDTANRLWRGPRWLRPAIGGILLGALLLAMPQLYGVGYPALEHAVGGGYTAWFLIGLLAGKLAATSLTIAIGGSGGVFAPSLFMGAMLGTAYGDLAGHLGSRIVDGPGAYGLVGMAAVFAAASRAPITATVIIFELSGDYHIILPLMVAVVVATALATVLSADSIYTLKLRRRGIDLHRARPSIFQGLTVGDAMRSLPPPVPADAPLPDLVRLLLLEAEEALPVAADDGSYVGVVASTDVELAVRDNVSDATAASLSKELPTVRDNQTLDTTLTLLARPDITGVPVLAHDDTPVGWITQRDVLRTCDRLLQAETTGNSSATTVNTHHGGNHRRLRSQTTSS